MTDDPWALAAKTDCPELEEQLRQRWTTIAQRDEYALLQDPVAVAVAFLKVLEAGAGEEDRLRAFVAPDTVDDWGDFSGARAQLERIGDWAFMTTADMPAPDVAYVYLLAGVQQSFVSDDDQIVLAATTVTLRRREGDWWQVIDFGAPPSSVESTG